MGRTGAQNPGTGRELVGWVILVLGVGALQLPAIGRMQMHGIDLLEFELMFTSAAAMRQVAALGVDGIAAVRQQLSVDFVYLVLYGTTLWKACRLLGARAARRGPAVVARLAATMAWVGVVAAVCDALENVALWVVSAGHTNQPWPGLASGYATAKFTLAATTLVFLLVGVLATFAGRRQGPADVERTQTG